MVAYPGGDSAIAHPARVVLSDAESIFRASLRHLLAAPPAVIKEVYGVDVGAGFRVVGEAEPGEETIKVVQSAKPDLLILDLCRRRVPGLDALRELESHQQMKTLLLVGAIERPNLLTAVQLGVRGVVLKDSTTELLFEALVGVMAGRYWFAQTLVTDLIEMVRPLIRSARAVGGTLAFGLTAREREILAMVAAGYSNKEIARKCAVAEETVKHHLTRIFNKVGASNRLQLAMVATRHGLDGVV